MVSYKVPLSISLLGFGIVLSWCEESKRAYVF